MLRGEGWDFSGSGDDLVELIKTGRVREIYRPEYREKLWEQKIEKEAYARAEEEAQRFGSEEGIYVDAGASEETGRSLAAVLGDDIKGKGHIENETALKSETDSFLKKVGIKPATEEKIQSGIREAFIPTISLRQNWATPSKGVGVRHYTQKITKPEKPMSKTSKQGTANIPPETTPKAVGENIPQRYLDAYELGKTARKDGYRAEDPFWTDVLYYEKYTDHPANPTNQMQWSDAKTRFFEAGFYGDDIPQIVRGWRWGKIPEAGKSTNFRDNRYEKGISLMALEGEKSTQGASLYQTFNAQGKKKVWVEGYYVGRGADGEPLVIDAKEIKKPTKIRN
jgi:hypothetical protein